MLDTPYLYFFTVARTNGFRKAAEELFVSQPAVSRQIKLLEERLGYPLFYRTTRRVSLTREGKLLYEALLESELALQRSHQAIAAIHGESSLSGHLRVGIHSGWSVALFHLPCFKDFAVHYPDVRQSFFCHGFLTLAEMLKENKLDIIVTNVDTAKADFDMQSTFFGTYYYKLVIASDHPLIQERRREMLACLGDLECYTHSSSLQNSDGRKRFLRDAIGTDAPIIVVPNVDAVFTAIENKQGFTVTLSCSRMCFLPNVRTYDLDKVTTLVIAHKKDPSDEVIYAFMNNLVRMQVEHS